MKNTKLPKGILQGLLFNIAIFFIFIVLIINYFIPQISEIEDKKEKLNKLQSENKELLKKGLDFVEFKKYFLKDNKKTNDYLKNILSNSSLDFKNVYESNFINSGTETYKEFIDFKSKEIKDKEIKLLDSKMREKIEKILPYYKSDSNLDGKGLTDFEFINYMEKIIHNFRLEYIGTIGIGNFVLEEGDKKFNSKKKQIQKDGEIYSFKLPLTLVGNKKSLIDFIYYIENVGNISFTKDGKDIKIKEINRKKSYENKEGIVIKNDFYNLPRYFLGEKDIFNNLIVDIEEIKLKDYIDSSLDPISYDKGETFINFIKNDQANEKYEIDITLKFYVKGLEKYKTIKYIKQVIFEYNNYLKAFNSAIKIGQKNISLMSSEEKLSLEELKKYNNYLNNLQKDIKDLSNKKKIDNDIGNIYRKAQSIKYIFDHKIKNVFETDLKNVSEKIYKNYKEIIKEKTND